MKLSPRQIAEKSESLVRELLWRAKSWSEQARYYRAKLLADLRKPTHLQMGAARRGVWQEEANRYTSLRREIMKDARRIAETFGLCCVKGSRA